MPLGTGFNPQAFQGAGPGPGSVARGAIDLHDWRRDAGRRQPWLGALLVSSLSKTMTKTAPAEYQIEYSEPLTNSQKGQLLQHMINGFPHSCQVNEILVGPDVVVKTESDCISAIDLKAASDRCLGQIGRIDEVKTIKLNGATIFTND